MAANGRKRPIFSLYLPSPFCYKKAIAMGSISKGTKYVVWSVDLQAHGPMDLPTLVTWVQSDRVTAETWIFPVKEGVWKRALDLFELQMFFWANARCPKPVIGTDSGLDPAVLRRLKVLADMTDDQLDRFCQFMEVLRLPQRATIVKQGDRGDAMYLVVQGELRVSMKVAGIETVLAILQPGDFFGDISLFDHGPRSADVIADTSTVVLKLSASAFAAMAKEAPDLATPFLLAIGRTLTSRIRVANKHHGEAVQFARAME